VEENTLHGNTAEMEVLFVPVVYILLGNIVEIKIMGRSVAQSIVKQVIVYNTFLKVRAQSACSDLLFLIIL
jgi:hypothetical protein